MQEILTNFPHYVDELCKIITALTIVATLVVRLTPSKSDDVLVDSFKAKLLKFLSYLPTWGINPRTKKLEEALKDQELPIVEDPSA
ncbi:MAG: hypothetical protein H0X02_08820 [Nitrosomonas sp.]|nr:hypothetical protein [Nitrosomonas sp.]